MLPFEEAVAEFKEILKHYPENSQIWCSWGVALLEMQQFDEAVEKFEKAVEFSPEFVSAWYGWGVALSALGQKEAAADKIHVLVQCGVRAGSVQAPLFTA